MAFAGSTASAGTAATIVAPPIGMSIFLIGAIQLSTGAFGPLIEYSTPSNYDAGVGAIAGHIQAATFLGGYLGVSDATAPSATVRSMAMSFDYTGTAAIQVDADSKTSGAVGAVAVTGQLGSFFFCVGQLAVTLQAIALLPGLYTAAQYSAWQAWGTVNHSYT
jgi:hypothetical protein